MAKYLRGKLLEEAIKNTQLVIDDQKKAWQRKGCNILLDDQIDGKNRTLLKFLVALSGILVFLNFVNDSHEIKNANTLCNLLDKVIQKVEIENVVQIIMGNATTYVVVVNTIMERPLFL